MKRIYNKKSLKFSMKIISAIVSFIFSCNMMMPPLAYAQGFKVLNLPSPGTMVNMTSSYQPVIMKGIIVHPEDPLKFDFIVNTGEDRLQGEAFKKEATQLIKYFLAALTIPEKELWVNLSPYENDRVVSAGFGETIMGRDMLAQDYMLKQLSASVMNPEDELGKKFWQRVYDRASKEYASAEIPMNTFNKIWVIPDKAVVYEKDGNAFVVDSHLKVMLEEDYVALQKGLGVKEFGLNSLNKNEAEVISGVNSEIIREVLIPEIEKEVNAGKIFANLRQIFNSLILASWYKENLKNSLLGQIYVDQAKTKGIDNEDKEINQKIYEQYVESFKKGVYNFIKEDYDPASQSVIPRKYFAGGNNFTNIGEIRRDLAMLSDVESQVLISGGENVRVEAVHVEIPQGTQPAAVEGAITVREPAPLPASSETITDGGDLGGVIERIVRAGQMSSLDSIGEATQPKGQPQKRSLLEAGHVIANHILVSFHAAFISGALSLPDDIATKWDVLKFLFMSPETLISLGFWWLSWHTGIAIHEMGHYLTAVKIDALNSAILADAKKAMAEKNIFKKLRWYLGMFAKIPYGQFKGVIKSGLNYYPDAPYNLRVAATGPAVSGKLALVGWTTAAALITGGLVSGNDLLTYFGRLALGIGAVGTLDFFRADPGKRKQYLEQVRQQEEHAKVYEQAAKEGSQNWLDEVGNVRERMIKIRPQIAVTQDGREIWVPWGFRNSGMGGRHTEKEYPESNISMQETMFIPLAAKSIAEAQEMTVKLQNTLKELIEAAEGGRVMGIGLEGGLAPYLAKGEGDKVPEQRLWRMAKEAIIKAGYRPGIDVAIALDPAASELEIAYREEFGQPDAVGMYLFWRSEDKVVMSRDEIFQLYKDAMEKDGVPIVSIEDGFAEDDDDGWRLIVRELGQKIFIIGDDQVTTKDESIERAADEGLNTTFLVKANQIGTLWETAVAVATAYGKGLETVVSHRSKSPNDDMESMIALAIRAVGLKAGGGANTERLVKYQAVARVVADALAKAKRGVIELSESNRALERELADVVNRLKITQITAWEEPTNAGIPTAKVRISFGIPGSQRFESFLSYEGSTPLGTSAGTGEAIHLVDSVIYPQTLTQKYPDLFIAQEDGSLRFKKGLKKPEIDGHQDGKLTELFERAQRFGGKGNFAAVDNVYQAIAPLYEGLGLAELGSIEDVDRLLLAAELKVAVERGQIKPNASAKEKIAIMQRKGNLGMNAILSQSLATARLIAAMQGRELSDLFQETLLKLMAKTIAANGGTDLLPQEAKMRAREAQAVSPKKELWKVLVDFLSFDEIKAGLRAVNQSKSKDTKLYELLRQQLDVYGVYGNKEASNVGAAVDAALLAGNPVDSTQNVGGINLNPAMLNLQIKRDGNGIPLPLEQQPIYEMKIEGFIPVIINVTPVNLPLILGVVDEGNDNPHEYGQKEMQRFLEAKNRFGLERSSDDYQKN